MNITKNIKTLEVPKDYVELFRLDHPPNWWWRMWQYLLLGWKWGKHE